MSPGHHGAVAPERSEGLGGGADRRHGAELGADGGTVAAWSKAMGIRMVTSDVGWYVSLFIITYNEYMI